MPKERSKSGQKVEKLQALLRPARSLLIVMQDNPDPDSIASAAALRRIANLTGDVSCSIGHGGAVGRAENRELIEYLGLNFRPMDSLATSRFDVVALVDCQPNTGNHSLPAEVVPDIVIDHHPVRAATRRVRFTDVRSRYGATSTILFEYLNELGIKPEAPLATALLYAIRTDTADLGKAAVLADREAANALLPLANTRMLSAIQRGRVGSRYYRMLAHALASARLRGPAILADLGEVDNPDILGEVADLLLRHEEIEWVLIQGVHQGVVWLSVRTTQNRVRAVDVVKGIAVGIGTAGGHEMSAGAQLPIQNGKATRAAIRRTVQRRFLRYVGAEGRASRRLLAR